MQPQANKKSDFFVYPLEFLALAAAATATQTLNFDAGSEFNWLYAAYSADVAAAGQTDATRVYPLCKIMLTPGDSNAQMMQSAIPLTHMFGVGENPFVLPAPRLFKARSTLQVQLTNYDAAQTYNIRLSLIGVKRYL